jgi:hypothetical protein
VSPIRIDRSSLLLIFNGENYVDRALSENWECCQRHLVRDVEIVTDGVIELVDKLITGWNDATGNLQFYAHCFLRKDGSIARSGLLDPKLVLFNGEYFGLLGSSPVS